MKFVELFARYRTSHAGCDRFVEIYRSFYAAFDAAWEDTYDAAWKVAMDAAERAVFLAAMDAARQAGFDAASHVMNDCLDIHCQP